MKLFSCNYTLLLRTTRHEQLARVDATDFGNEAAVRAQSVRALALRGGAQSTRRKPCTAICP